MRRILVVNPFGVGDVLCATPLVTAIRKQFPDAYLAFLCNVRTRDVLVNNPDLDRVWVFEKDEYRALWRRTKWIAIRLFFKLLRSIRSERFNIVVDLSLGDRYSAVMKLLRIPVRVGFNYRGRGRFLTQSVPIEGFNDKHVVEHYFDVGRLIGCVPQPSPYVFPVSTEAEQWVDGWMADRGIPPESRLVAVAPAGGASWGSQAVNRHWPAERFAAVADGLFEQGGARVVLVGGGPEEVERCHQVERFMRHRAENAGGQTTLDQFAALLKRCELVVSNDGGPMHVAVSQGCRVVSIFGPVDDQVYGPYPRTERTIALGQSLPCRPCYRSFRLPPCPINLECLTSLMVDQVLDTAITAWSQGADKAPVTTRSHS